eukprot:3296514-Pyramimonas_sp.AAC.1
MRLRSVGSRMRVPPLTFSGALYEATELWIAALGGEPHATSTIGTFGAPYGAPTRSTWRGSRMRAPPLGPSVGPSMGPRSAVLGGGAACEFPHRDL